MRHNDSIDKIICVYLSSVCSHSFSYKGKTYSPKRLVVSPLLLRGHTCPSNCGACCGSFSLDFLPSERCNERAKAREILISGNRITIRSDLQIDIDEHWCRNLNRESGRCSIYQERPFACDFELIRFLSYETKVLLIHKQYGRFWAMERLHGGDGALCEMLPRSESLVREVVRKLTRLEDWAMHFKVKTRIPLILNWIESGDTNTALILNP